VGNMMQEAQVMQERGQTDVESGQNDARKKRK